MISVEHLSFTYGGSTRPVISDVSLQFNQGEFAIIVGLSGSGKSTLCRALNGLIPHFYGGKMSGQVTVDGQDTKTTSPAKLAGSIGMVFQDPENQLVMTNVENEMAFGMENMALPKAEMSERIGYYSKYFDVARFFSRFIPELSGGEKQKVALASVLAMRPKYIILDEPTSQLDEETAALFLDFLHKLNTEQGVGIILVEHRLERCLRYAQRIVIMKDGAVAADGCCAEVMPKLREEGLIADFHRLAEEDGRGDVVVSVHHVDFSYGTTPILNGLDLEVHHQEVLAVIGANGCGKSTLLKQLNGLLRPKQGSVAVLGRDIISTTTASLAHDIGYVGQNPNNYLFEDTLQKELEFTLKNLGIAKGEWRGRIDWALKVLNLERYRLSFPRSLSCGERERAALASIIVGKPKILILDEPTRGMDYWNKIKLASILDELRRQGMTTIIVTHDYRFVAEHATRVLYLNEGRLSEVPIEKVVSLARQMAGQGG
jgi:energy-coupling factor transporter ATP-binding protein EcfA2